MNAAGFLGSMLEKVPDRNTVNLKKWGLGRCQWKTQLTSASKKETPSQICNN